MKNRNFKKTLALILSLMMIFAAVSTGTVLADTGYVGNAENGYTGVGDIINATPNTMFKNFDFEDGFNYWQKGVAGEYASIVTEENGNKALKLACDDSVNSWKRFITAYPITVKNVSVGSEFGIRYDVKVKNFSKGGSNMCNMVISTTTADVTFSTGHNYRCNINANTDGYVTYAGRYKVTALPEGVDEITVYFYPNIGSVVADVYLDNISIGFQPDTALVYSNNGRGVNYPTITENADTLVLRTQGTFEMYDLSDTGYYGGVNYNYNGTTYLPVCTDSFINGSFEQGLTGWGAFSSYNSVPVKPSDYTTISDFDNDGDNEARLTYTSGARTGLISPAFPLTGLKAGDTVTLYFEYKWVGGDTCNNGATIEAAITNKVSGEIKQSNSGAYTKTVYSTSGTPTFSGGTHTAIGDGWYAATSTGSTATLQVDSPEAIICIANKTGGASDIYIDNIKIIVGRDYSATGTKKISYEYYGADNDGKYYETDGITETVAPLGTAADGISTTTDIGTYAFRLKGDTANIFDFANNGLKYWSANLQDYGAMGETKASDTATINEDGSVTLKYASKAAQGISSVYFPLPQAVVDAGTNYAVWLNYSRTATEVEDATTSFLYAYSEDIGMNAGYNSSGESSGVATFNAPAKTINNIAYGNVSLKVGGTEYNYTVSDFVIGYVDKGGMEKALYVYQDGKPRDAEMGDANADNAINVKDLVRMKKRSADTAQAIYLAAADANGNGTIDSDEILSVRSAILG